MDPHHGDIDDVVVLGAGYAGRAVLARARALGLRGTAVVRRAEAVAPLAPLGLSPEDIVVAPVFDRTLGDVLARRSSSRLHVVVAFPPDGRTDALVADVVPATTAITLLSATGVYGDHRGTVDDATPVTGAPSPTAARRLEAEAVWRARGATILRCPSIYGPDRGLHVRVLGGAHRIPGDGRGHVSRIHVEDLAALVLASSRVRGETFVVGDDEPAPYIDVVRWICATYGVPLPASVPLDTVHETLRGDRRVDGSRALRVLGVRLAYPTFRVGMLGARPR